MRQNFLKRQLAFYWSEAGEKKTDDVQTPKEAYSEEEERGFVDGSGIFLIVQGKKKG